MGDLKYSIAIILQHVQVSLKHHEFHIVHYHYNSKTNIYILYFDQTAAGKHLAFLKIWK